ncbi:MAG TPA: M20/M25/M40 family metallo-hydrolase [Candidatus Limnocylindrales bacterium]|nr:M20/M25/M40 family metallo-hydrolase [Candidatus Limnocylindrales bacterium]
MLLHKTFFIASALNFLCLNCAAQNPPSTTTFRSYEDRVLRAVKNSNGAWTTEQIATMERVRDAAMQNSYPSTELRHLTDNIGPRLSGSPQAQQAVEYVAAEMRALGAQVQLEKTIVPHWVRGVETAELVNWPGQTPGTTQKIVLTALGGSGATPSEGLQAEVLVVNSFDEFLRLPPDSAKGKILLFNERFDKQLAAQGHGNSAYGKAVIYRAAGPNIGATAGAVAVLIRSVGGADFRLPHTGATLPSAPGQAVPAAGVSAEDADLLASLSRQGSVRIRLTLTPRTLPSVESYNVIADWKGSEHPEQIVIVSGHLDSWDLGTGAIDDGAGVAISMQVIHLLKELGLHPKRTIRFIAWMDEEEGAEGADTYAKDHAGDIANHIAALESDLGAGHPTGFYFVGKPELEEWMRPVARVLESIGASTISSTREVGTDVDPLNRKGVPGFSPAQDNRFYFNYHHTAADTFDKVDARELNENAAVMSVLAYALADSAEPAPR